MKSADWRRTGQRCEAPASLAGSRQRAFLQREISLEKSSSDGVDELPTNEIQPRNVTENGMKIHGWNDWITALSLVHLGQQLGTETPAAQAVFDLVSVISVFFWK
jgi:hypothetical protein